MDISTFGYNIPFVTITPAITVDTKTKVGTIEDFQQLLSMVKASGLIRGQLTLGSQYMDGVMIASPWQYSDGIEAFTISKAGESPTPYIVSCEIELEDDGCYVTVSITTLS